MTTKLIRDAIMMTMNTTDDIVRGDVLIQGNRIAQIGRNLQVEAEVTVEARGRVLLPGFVQTHVHLCQTLFRGQADDLELIDWLRQRIWPLEAAHNEESVYYSAMLGAGELIRSGTTTVLDMETVHHTDSAFRAIEQSGLRAVSGKVMMDYGTEVPLGLQEKTADSLAESVRLLEKWHGAAGGRISYAFCPRFVVSCTEELLVNVRDLSEQYGVKVHTHASENRGEIAIVEADRGMRNVVYLDHIGLARPNLILAHSIWLDEEEKRIIRERGVKVTHCPGSNLKLASGIADVPEMMALGIPVGLGADGAPCNNNLDMFQEMRLAALIQKVKHGPMAMDAKSVLRLATMGGAEVLGMEDEIGSIEPGKLADLQLLDLEDFHTYPSYDADWHSRVVYAATRGDVDTVLINGELVMQGKTVRTLDKAHVLKEADRCLKELLTRL
ncbi:N-ethylammeline chlorohydrolase [Paenibacillus darwinianus]|uniref:5-methylthioadenosine/S-adenosylhomocysteine deaminase n=1 Tax=Paenibacillus darwinianus TaxID=1380763 RepID=A0A9W5RZY0_9BACL|nr:5'-deoxyadenosine deaminase [Paenibacillus darwinianus]EXX86938.1 N-ethylammeline chlorohydrolase [Paenibacillus darwinianus]EXX87237.1 N-ethylammeline chlorohydrolase [Paenibacillus darwinianus]EXX88597.1 N-ethylammeline chlorohydrolase [Paenibacillus darwinianus]